jgi:hypothetical protein
MIPGKTEGILWTNISCTTSRLAKPCGRLFSEEKHEKVTTHGRVSFSPPHQCSDGENTANIPFRGVWGRKLLCGGYLKVR